MAMVVATVVVQGDMEPADESTGAVSHFRETNEIVHTSWDFFFGLFLLRAAVVWLLSRVVHLTNHRPFLLSPRWWTTRWIIRRGIRRM